MGSIPPRGNSQHSKSKASFPSAKLFDVEGTARLTRIKRYRKNGNVGLGVRRRRRGTNKELVIE